MDLHQLKDFLRFHNLRPKDYLGQNFLIDEDALDVIVDTADLKKTDEVLEVGPGLGFLTSRLSPVVKKVFAVEKDQRMMKILKSELRDLNNVEIINQDILRFHVGEHINGDYKIVANIPYYLTSKLIQTFLTTSKKPKVMVLMVQKEVAERIVAPAGELSILGISVQFFADVEIVSQVPKQNFYPQPEVDSAIIRIEPKNKYPGVDEKLLFRIIKIAFSGKRKQIHNTLSSGLKITKEEATKLLEKAKIDPNTRPQDLKIEDWISLSKAI